MKICYIAHLPDLSGANKSLLDIVKKNNEIHDVMVIIPRPGKLSEKMKEIGISYKIIPSALWMDFEHEGTNLKKNTKIILNFFAEINFFLFFFLNKFDIVHFNSLTYGTGAKSLKILRRKFIWHARELPEKVFNLKYHDKQKSKNLISHSAAIISISQTVESEMNLEFPDSKICLIYNGIDLPTHSNSIIQKKEITKLLLVGAIAPDKGQLEAVQSLKYLLDHNVKAEIYLVGKVIDNNYMKVLNEYIETNKLHEFVHFEGYSEDIEAYREKCGICLVCSVNEAFGRVTVEGMLNDQLVIGANTGGTKEILKDNFNGLLYEQGNAESLASKINYAINTLSEYERMNILKNAHEDAIRRFSMKKVIENLQRIYEDVHI